MSKSTPAYSTQHVTSNDGTSIGYRQLGRGPGVVLVHGGMQAAQNFMKLAEALSDDFSVHVLDRRGRGASGPHGGAYSVARECEDVDALLKKTGARSLFGLSSGAIVVLEAARTLSGIDSVALYEPPLPLDGTSPAGWLPRFDEEMARGDLAAAMVTVLKGTGDPGFFTGLPRFLLERLIRLGVRADAKEAEGDDVPIRALIPTMHYDARMVLEMTGKIESFREMPKAVEVLLLGGDKSRDFLTAVLDALSALLPRCKRVELHGVGHLAADNEGKPEVVARHLHRFFTASKRQTSQGNAESVSERQGG